MSAIFVSKSDIENWSERYLNKNSEGDYVCPISGEVLKIVRCRSFWRFEGLTENWMWDVEDLKDGEWSFD